MAEAMKTNEAASKLIYQTYEKLPKKTTAGTTHSQEGTANKHSSGKKGVGVSNYAANNSYIQ